MEFFRLGLSFGCSKREFGGARFFGLFDLPEARVDIEVGELDEILVSVDFFLLLLVISLLRHVDSKL